MFIDAWLSKATLHLYAFGNWGDSVELTAGIAACKKIEQIDKDGYTAKFARLIYTYRVSQDYDKVIRDGNKLLEQFPYSNAKSYLTLSQRRKGNYQEYIYMACQQLREDPLNSGILRDVAQTLLMFGQSKKAIKYVSALKGDSYYCMTFARLIIENKINLLDSLLNQAENDASEYFSEEGEK